MIEEIALVRLVPTKLISCDSADVKPVHVGSRDQTLDQFRIGSDCSNHQAWTKRLRNLFLIDFHHTRKREQKLFVCKLVFRRLAEHNCR